MKLGPVPISRADLRTGENNRMKRYVAKCDMWLADINIEGLMSD
jgi:hypothetical protein